MSAFICSHQHINAIIRWASRHKLTMYYGNPSRRWRVAGNEQATAELLYSENVASFNHRYLDHKSNNSGIVYDAFAPDLQAIEVIKACNCLNYQSCEHPGWEASLACQLLTKIQDAAVNNLPGYEAARWHIEA